MAKTFQYLFDTSNPQPYVPTRLEWLALELNAEQRVDLTLDSAFGLTFVPLGTQDTILIWVVYLPSVDRRIMNVAIEGARKAVAARRGGKGLVLLAEDQGTNRYEGVQVLKVRLAS